MALAVPNTTTFSLLNVTNVVFPTTNDLIDCFADAVASYFNLLYSGSKNSLLNFRDYGVHNAGTASISANPDTLYFTSSGGLMFTTITTGPEVGRWRTVSVPTWCTYETSGNRLNLTAPTYVGPRTGYAVVEHIDDDTKTFTITVHQGIEE